MALWEQSVSLLRGGQGDDAEEEGEEGEDN